ncbi:MAG TPA: heme exporter protein CcmB [Actinomycetota bacterium]|nr:heme exporter protein CcmB [Actinomycetota bacterium]
MNNLQKMVLLAGKDLRSELRGREILPPMLIFGFILVFLFTINFPAAAGRAPVPPPSAGGIGSRTIAAAFLWVSVLFAGVLGFSRNASMEREGSRMEGLLLSPVDPAALFAGKALANFCYLWILELVVFPAFVLFFDVAPGTLLPGILAVALATNVGLASAGTLLGAASQYVRARELILPLLLFPIVLPLVLGAERLTASLLNGAGLGPQSQWFMLMGTFDLAIPAVGAVVFEYVVNE